LCFQSKIDILYILCIFHALYPFLLTVLLKFVLPFKTLLTHKVKKHYKLVEKKIMVPYKLLIKYNSYSTNPLLGIIFFHEFYKNDLN